MGFAFDMIGIVIKSVFSNKIKSELGNDLIGVPIDAVLEKGENVISDFVNSETSKMEQVLSKENMKSMNISEDRIDFVTEEIKELLLKVKITEEEFRKCGYSCENLEEYLWDEYSKSKNGCIEYEADIKKGFRAVAKVLITLKYQSEGFEKKLLTDMSGSTDEMKEGQRKIYEYIREKFDNLDKNIQTLLEQKKNTNEFNKNIHQKIGSKTSEYADKWNENMFLNNFSEWDENAGINVKLKEVYLEFHLPHFIWNKNENFSINLKDLLSNYMNINDKQMLLILGQPGIGKSTLITWITANYNNIVDKILVYQFASDLKNIDRYNLDMNKKQLVLGELKLSLNDLEGKILILDGFDEISVGNDRLEILNCLYRDTSLQLFRKKIQTRVFYCIIKATNKNYTKRDEFVSTAYYT